MTSYKPYMYKPYINHASTLPQSCPVPQLCHRNYSFLPQPRPYHVPTWPQACPKKLKVHTSIVPQLAPTMSRTSTMPDQPCPDQAPGISFLCPNRAPILLPPKNRDFSHFIELLVFINKNQFSISLKL